MGIVNALAAYDTYEPAQSGLGFLVIVEVAVAVLLITAWIMAIRRLIDAAEAKLV